MAARRESYLLTWPPGERALFIDMAARRERVIY